MAVKRGAWPNCAEAKSPFRNAATDRGFLAPDALAAVADKSRQQIQAPICREASAELAAEASNLVRTSASGIGDPLHAQSFVPAQRRVKILYEKEITVAANPIDVVTWACLVTKPLPFGPRRRVCRLREHQQAHQKAPHARTAAIK
jgi:hypothetical protein